jgi:CDP-glycerol glycerophosphotransferase (TagB/SpsB family)
MGSRPMNEIIMECSACITDYSSVAWDVLYQEKPVVYFQFDQERYLDEVGSYIDLNTELPGPVCKDTSEVVQAISDLIANDFTLSPEDVEKTNDWYAFKDTNNRKRTFDFLQERYPFD